MTDFQFTNGSGVNVTLRTDLIGLNKGSENLTVCDIVGINTDTERSLFAFMQKNKTTVSALKTFATNNSLTLKAIVIGSQASEVTLVP